MTIANLFKLAHVYKQTTLRIFPCPLKKTHIKIIYIVKFILHFLMQSLCIWLNSITLIRPKLKYSKLFHTSPNSHHTHLWSPNPPPPTPQTNTFFWRLSHHVHVLSLHLYYICPLVYTGKRYIKFIYLYFDHKTFFPSLFFVFFKPF